MRGRQSSFVAAIVLGVAALVAAQQPPPVPEVTGGGDDLVKKKGFFREIWVHPDADLTRYSKLYFWQAMFQFRDVAAHGGASTVAGTLRNVDPYPVSEEAKAKFKKVFLDAFVEELQRSKQFQVVNTLGPDTLILRAGIIDIISDVPPAARHFDVRLSAVGEGTFVVQMIDPTSGVIQATVGERRKIQPGAGAGNKPATESTVWTDVEQWARMLGMDFRRELDKAKKKAEEKK
jgi:hypothetical protein